MRRRRHGGSRRGARGFSLIEAMLAAAVFTVGALGLLRLTVSSAEGLGTASRLMQATVLAESKLGELMDLPYDDADLAAGGHDEPGGKNLGPAGTPFTPSGVATGDFGAEDGWFARSWEVEERDVNPAAAGNELKLIHITVRWMDRAFSTARSVTVTGGKSRVR